MQLTDIIVEAFEKRYFIQYNVNVNNGKLNNFHLNFLSIVLS